MLELPRHHVPRPGLLAKLAGAAVVVIEAASGFGKSTLAAELTAGARSADVALTGEHAGRHALLIPLLRALRRVGEHEAAAALGEVAATPSDALDAMCDALRRSSDLTLVVDDAHHLEEDAGLLVQLVSLRPPPLRLVISARALPAAATKLRTAPGAVHVDANDLRFDANQAVTLLRDGFGAEPDDKQVARLTTATGGWPAALAFLGSQLQRSPDSLVERDAEIDLSSLVLDALPEQLRQHAIQIAHFSWLDHDLVAAATGRPRLLHDLLDAGVPLTPDRDGGYLIPGAFADALSRHAPFDRDIARYAARWHLGHARPFDAMSVLRRARDWDALADLLVDLPPAARMRLTADELTSTVDALPEATIQGRPRVLIELARALSRAGVPSLHLDLLDRAEQLGRDEPAPYHRAVEAQRLGDALFVEDRAEVAKRTGALLAAAGAGEDDTIARALIVLGVLDAWAGRRDEAARSLRRAASLFVDLGEPYEASRALVQLGFNVDLHVDPRAAERTFDEGVELAGTDGRARATALTYRGECRAWLGRCEEGARDLQEAMDLARAVRDSRAQAYAAWGLALLASLENDAERTVARVQEAERQLRSWSETGVGATFEATMVDLLDRAGAHEQADAMLERARRRREEQPELVAIAEFVVAARRGDPAEAERLWPTIEADEGIEPFEQARCRLLRAYAALRADHGTVDRLYREALAHAEALELPDLGDHLEPVAAAALRHHAARTDGAWEVRCIGPLVVLNEGNELELPPGRPTTLVGLLAIADGPRRVTSVIDVLWPDVSEADGRVRLRQVLYRLRRAAPGLVAREGDDQLALSADVRVDLHRFDVLVRAAGRGGPRSLSDAADAVRLVRGQLLADIELDTASGEVEVTRAQVRVRYLGLLDRLAGCAEQDGDLDSTISWTRRAVDDDPTDEVRALHLARLQLAAGHATEAAATVATTTAALRHLGVEPSDALLSFARHRGHGSPV